MPRFAWNANTEPTLGGYKIHVGQQSGVYTAPGSPFDVGNVLTAFLASTFNGPAFYALQAYLTTGELSGLTAELTGVFDTPASAVFVFTGQIPRVVRGSIVRPGAMIKGT